MNIKKLQKEVYNNTIRLGYDVDKSSTITKLDEELFEFIKAKEIPLGESLALEYAYTDIDFKNKFESNVKGSEFDEIPDMFFILLSYCESKGYDFEMLVKNKLRYNAMR